MIRQVSRAMLVACALTLAVPASGQTEPVTPTTGRVVELAQWKLTDYPELMRYASSAGPWGGWITLDDIPAASWPDTTAIRIDVRITIAPDDSIARCEAQNDRLGDLQEVASPALLKLACDLVRRRGHFRHALSVDGSPVAGVVKMELSLLTLSPPVQDGSREANPDTRWYAVKPPPYLRALPWHDAKPLSLSLRALPAMKRLPSVQLDISATGEVTRCEVDESSGSDAGDAAVCRQLRATRFTPATNWAGDAVAQPWLSLDLSQYT